MERVIVEHDFLAVPANDAVLYELEFDKSFQFRKKIKYCGLYFIVIDYKKELDLKELFVSGYAIGCTPIKPGLNKDESPKNCSFSYNNIFNSQLYYRGTMDILQNIINQKIFNFTILECNKKPKPIDPNNFKIDITDVNSQQAQSISNSSIDRQHSDSFSMINRYNRSYETLVLPESDSSNNKAQSAFNSPTKSEESDDCSLSNLFGDPTALANLNSSLVVRNSNSASCNSLLYSNKSPTANLQSNSRLNHSVDNSYDHNTGDKPNLNNINDPSPYLQVPSHYTPLSPQSVYPSVNNDAETINLNSPRRFDFISFHPAHSAELTSNDCIIDLNLDRAKICYETRKAVEIPSHNLLCNEVTNTSSLSLQKLTHNYATNENLLSSEDKHSSKLTEMIVSMLDSLSYSVNMNSRSFLYLLKKLTCSNKALFFSRCYLLNSSGDFIPTSKWKEALFNHDIYRKFLEHEYVRIPRCNIIPVINYDCKVYYFNVQHDHSNIDSLLLANNLQNKEYIKATTIQPNKQEEFMFVKRTSKQKHDPTKLAYLVHNLIKELENEVQVDAAETSSRIQVLALQGSLTIKRIAKTKRHNMLNKLFYLKRKTEKSVCSICSNYLNTTGNNYYSYLQTIHQLQTLDQFIHNLELVSTSDEAFDLAAFQLIHGFITTVDTFFSAFINCKEELIRITLNKKKLSSLVTKLKKSKNGLPLYLIDCYLVFSSEISLMPILFFSSIGDFSNVRLFLLPLILGASQQRNSNNKLKYQVFIDCLVSLALTASNELINDHFKDPFLLDLLAFSYGLNREVHSDIFEHMSNTLHSSYILKEFKLQLSLREKLLAYSEQFSKAGSLSRENAASRSEKLRKYLQGFNKELTSFVNSSYNEINNFSAFVPLPNNPSKLLHSFNPDKCNVIKSSKYPLRLSGSFYKREDLRKHRSSALSRMVSNSDLTEYANDTDLSKTIQDNSLESNIQSSVNGDYLTANYQNDNDSSKPALTVSQFLNNADCAINLSSSYTAIGHSESVDDDNVNIASSKITNLFDLLTNEQTNLPTINNGMIGDLFTEYNTNIVTETEIQTIDNSNKLNGSVDAKNSTNVENVNLTGEPGSSINSAIQFGSVEKTVRFDAEFEKIIETDPPINKQINDNVTECTNDEAEKQKIELATKYKLDEFVLLYKFDDDVRLDCFVVELFAYIDHLRKLYFNEDPRLCYYRVLPMSKKDGFIEFVENSYSLTSIEKSGYTIDKYLKKEKAKENFIDSAAAYSVLTYLLGVGDRHKDNILLKDDGCLFHVDFGFLFGSDPKIFGQVPMRITDSMVSAMGGVQSNDFINFVIRILTVHLQMRLIAPKLETWIKLVCPNIFENGGNSTLFFERLNLYQDDIQALDIMLENVIFKSIGNFVPALLDYVHNFVLFFR